MRYLHDTFYMLWSCPSLWWSNVTYHLNVIPMFQTMLSFEILLASGRAIFIHFPLDISKQLFVFLPGMWASVELAHHPHRKTWCKYGAVPAVSLRLHFTPPHVVLKVSSHRLSLDVSYVNKKESRWTPSATWKGKKQNNNHPVCWWLLSRQEHLFFIPFFQGRWASASKHPPPQPPTTQTPSCCPSSLWHWRDASPWEAMPG